MKIFSSLVGLLLVGVMACTGLGQNWASCEALANDCLANINNRNAEEENVRGAYAYAMQLRNDCVNLRLDIDAVLNGPHFDPNYNGDPAMLIAKQAFQDALNARRSDAADAYDNYVTNLADFNSWVGAHSSAANRATLDYWWDKMIEALNTVNAALQASRYAAAESALTDLKALTADSLAAVEDFENTATNTVVCEWEGVKFATQALLDAVNAY